MIFCNYYLFTIYAIDIIYEYQLNLVATLIKINFNY